jgi:hypothetical protein
MHASAGPPRDHSETSSLASQAGPALAPDLIGQPGETPVTTPDSPAVSETGSPIMVAQDIEDSEDTVTPEPIIVNTSTLRAPPTLLVIQPGDPSYSDACASIADVYVLMQYHNKFYNLPLPSKSCPPPPFYCITRSNYIGVFPGW